MVKRKNKYFGSTLTYFIIIVSFILIRLASFYNLLSFMGDYATYVFNIVLQVGLMFMLPIFLYSYFIKQKPVETLKTYGFKKTKLSAIGIAIIIGLIVFILNIGVSSFFSLILSILGYEKLSGSAPVENYTIIMLISNLFFVAVLPAICEEVTHRGMLIDGFSKLGYKKTILFSALLFGLTHLNIEQFFYASAIGALLGFITMTTGNILPAIIIHFINNAVSVVINYAIATNPAFSNAYNGFFLGMTQENFVLVISALFFVISFLLLILGYLMYALFKETTVHELNQLAEAETKKQLRAELMDERPKQVKPNFTDIPFRIVRGNRSFNVYVSSKTLRHPIKQIYFPSLYQKTFFIASFITGVLLTISTFIWGVL